MSASQQVDVEVRDSFAAVGTVINDRAETRLIDSELARYFPSREQQMAENFLICCAGIADSGNGFARNNQDVSGGLRRNIPEGTTNRIMVDDVRWDLAVIDFFKKRLHVAVRIAANAGIASSGNIIGLGSSALQKKVKTI